jgi:hypothetical protein
MARPPKISPVHIVGDAKYGALDKASARPAALNNRRDGRAPAFLNIRAIRRAVGPVCRCGLHGEPFFARGSELPMRGSKCDMCVCTPDNEIAGCTFFQLYHNRDIRDLSIIL